MLQPDLLKYPSTSPSLLPPSNWAAFAVNIKQNKAFLRIYGFDHSYTIISLKDKSQKGYFGSINAIVSFGGFHERCKNSGLKLYPVVLFR